MIIESARAAIIKQYRAGQTVRSLAVEFQLGIASIYTVLAEAGVRMRARGRRPGHAGPSKVTGARTKAVRVLRHRHQWSLDLIAAAFGTDVKSVQRMLYVPLPQSGPPKYIPADLTSAERDV